MKSKIAFPFFTNSFRKLFVLLFFTVIYFSSKATDRYVSTSGNNANAGTLASPWRTVNYAVNFSGLAAGDIIHVRGGTYNERVIMTKSGTSGNYITVKKYLSETPVIDGTGISWTPVTGKSADGLFQIQGSYIIIDGFNVINSTAHPDASGINIWGPSISFVTIKNCYTNNTRSSGISCWGYSAAGTYSGATDIIIENNTVTYAINDGYEEHISIASGVDRFEVRYNTVRDGAPLPRSPNLPIGIDAKVNVRNGKIFGNTVYNLAYSNGIYVDGWDDHAYNIDIYNNIIHDVANAGIQVGAENGGIANYINIYNNLVYLCGQNGLKIAQAYGNGTISNINLYNNTVYGCSNASAIIEGTTASVVFKNNIFADNAWNNGVYLYTSNKSNVTIDKNVVWQYVGRSYSSPQMEEVKGTNVIELDPLFANIATNNYRLGPSSPAINSATSSLVPANDLDGNARPAGGAYDIGAYEYGATSSIPVTGVTVSPTTASVPAFTTRQLTATIAPSNATNQTVSWSSSNTAVATVNSTGLITAVAAGSAVITVTTQDGNFTATCSTTVTAAINLISNFGFESSFTNWSTTGNSTINTTGSNIYEGTKSAKLTGASGGYSWVGRTITGLTANTTYTLSAYCKKGGGTINGYIYATNYGGSVLTVNCTSTSYTKLSITFTTGASSTSVNIGAEIDNTSASNIFYVDKWALNLGNSTAARLAPSSIITFSSSIVNPKQIDFDWSVNKSNDIFNFELEKSTDNIKFSKCEEISSYSTSAANNSFTVRYNNPNITFNYFRIKINRKDNSSSYSKSIKLDSDIYNNVLQISPNPAKTDIRVRVSNAIELSEVSILDVSGRIFKMKKFTSSIRSTIADFSIPLDNMKPGTYFLRAGFKNGGNSIKKFLVIQ